MSDHDKTNGRPALPFKPTGNEPIVGQPMEILGFCITGPLICRCCDNPKPMLVSMTVTMATGAAPASNQVQCPECGRKWMIGLNTKVEINVALVGSPTRGALTS